MSFICNRGAILPPSSFSSRNETKKTKKNKTNKTERRIHTYIQSMLGNLYGLCSPLFLFGIVCASRVELFFLAGIQKKKQEMEDDPLKAIQAGYKISSPQSFFFLILFIFFFIFLEWPSLLFLLSFLWWHEKCTHTQHNGQGTRPAQKG